MSIVSTYTIDVTDEVDASQTITFTHNPDTPNVVDLTFDDEPGETRTINISDMVRLVRNLAGT